jgi:hypothetical protein
MQPTKVLAILVATTLAAGSARAVVIRHDVADCAYVIPASAFPALAELPWDGQGVLIAPRWVVTVAHVTALPITQVIINGAARRVSRVVVHPGYREPPSDAGDAARLMAAKIANDDIALLELAEPVRDVAPVPLYRGPVETGLRIEILGRGATGNGVTGQAPDSPHRGALRRAFSRVTSAEGRWLTSRFDPPPATEALAGTAGDGDSGGPVLILSRGAWRLAGLTSWKSAEGNPADFHPGLYGQISYSVRLSHYADWMRRVMAQPANVAAATRQTSPASQIIVLWDSDHDGGVSQAEWTAAAQLPAQAFARVDANHDARVDEAELTAAITAVQARQAQQQAAAVTAAAQCLSQ